MRKLVLSALIGCATFASAHETLAQGQAVIGAMRQICSRNIYGQVSCYVIANEAYNYGRQAIINQYCDLRNPPQRFYYPPQYAYPQTTPYMIRRRW